MVAAISVLDQLDPRTLEILERRRRVEGLRRRGWIVRRALLAADVVGLVVAFTLSELLYGGGSTPTNRLGTAREFLVFALAVPAWVVAAKLYGLYDRDEERTDHTTADDFAGVFHLVTITSWLLFAFGHITRLADPALPKLFLFWILAVTGVASARAAGRAYCRTRIEYLQNTVIVGAGDVGQSLARKLLKHPEYGLNLVGFVDDTPREREPGLEHMTMLGVPGDLPDLIRLLDIERVIVAFTSGAHEELLGIVRALNLMSVQVDVVPRLFEVVGAGVALHAVEGVPMIGLPAAKLSRSSALIKRWMDVAVASTALVVLAPFFALIGLLIKLDSPGPVFFRQVRAGGNERLFRIWKFRTMTLDAEDRKDEIRHLNLHAADGDDARMFKAANDPRTTRVGRVLRRYSIDELPQLINVVAGEMSLVGPRPLILEESRHVADWGRRRLDLRPGMTGLWQVLGRSDIPFSEMVRLDYVYVTGWSLLKDFQLILRTIPALFRARQAA
jgi:exopolysaccharide biosynthesis polyprenyl glycosylphosphotransferase